MVSSERGRLDSVPKRVPVLMRETREPGHLCGNGDLEIRLSILR